MEEALDLSFDRLLMMMMMTTMCSRIPVGVAHNSTGFNVLKSRNKCCGRILFTCEAYVWLGNQFGYNRVF